MEWSQDGTKLLVSGPVAQEKEGIWVISVIGASLKKLRDDAHDASLSPDGSQIVFRDAVSNEIWVMAADGQQAHLLTKPEEGYHLFKPTWLPNGQRVIYGKYRVQNGRATLALESRDLKGTDPVVLLSNPRLADFCWGQNGSLIYSVGEPPPNQYDANLWELRFDPETGRPKGAPRRLTDWTGFAFDDLTLTADGSRLVFLSDHFQSDVYVSELMRNGTELEPPQRMTLDERLDWPGGWAQDGKTVFLYSDRNGNFDIYKQGVNDRNADALVTGPDEKWAPQVSPDGRWVVYIDWPKVPDGTPVTSGKIMRVPVGGGPPEAVMDVKGHPGVASSGNVNDTVGGYPSFRCPAQASATCVLAEADEKQIVFTAFDPAQGRKSELTKVAAVPFLAGWDLSPDGARIAISTFDYKAGDVQIIPVSGGTPQKLSALPWAELTALAWSADGKALFLTSFSSRGTSIVRMNLDGKPGLLLKTTRDIFSIVPSPGGHYLALGPVIDNANAWTIASFPAK